MEENEGAAEKKEKSKGSKGTTREKSKRQKKKNSTKKKKKEAAASTAPTVKDQDKHDPAMVQLANVMNQMRPDFIVVMLQPRCYHCETYITTEQRFYCPKCKQHGFDFYLCDKCYGEQSQMPDEMRHPSAQPEVVHELVREVCTVAPTPNADDDILECEFFSTRQQFLSLCQGNHYQFDQLRRAKHTSMMVLYHLHNPENPSFVHTCNRCNKDIEGDRWTCRTCTEFDICSSCHDLPSFTHQHKLERISHHLQVSHSDALSALAVSLFVSVSTVLPDSLFTN